MKPESEVSSLDTNTLENISNPAARWDWVRKEKLTFDICLKLVELKLYFFPLLYF